MTCFSNFCVDPISLAVLARTTLILQTSSFHVIISYLSSSFTITCTLSFVSALSLCPPLLSRRTHTQDREAVEVANLEERKLVLKFEADELDRTRDELVRSLEEKRKSQVINWLAGSEMRCTEYSMKRSTRAD